MYKNRSRGFTLIELLVVIAIIGVLSAVVLASLNTARSKGNDAAIKSNLGTVLTQSAIYYDTYSAYVSAGTPAAVGTPTVAACGTATSLFADANVTQALISSDKAAGGPGTTLANMTKTYCGFTGSLATWVVYTVLLNNGATGQSWCVDSSGNSKQIATPAGALANC